MLERSYQVTNVSIVRTDDDRKTVKRLFDTDELLSCKQAFQSGISSEGASGEQSEPREYWGNPNRGSLRTPLAPQIYVPREIQVGELACGKANALVALERLF